MTHRYFFDLTTSAKWSGPAVGIVRVERELAKRAAKLVGSSLAFTVYDPHQATFVEIGNALVPEILSGQAVIDFDLHRQAPVPPASTARRRVRQFFLDRPRAYRAVQRIRGHRFSLQDIANIVAAERRAAAVPSAPVARKLSLYEASIGPATLNADSVLLSGGLDWDTKDLRGLWRLKKEIGFRYIAILYDLIPIMLPHYVVPGYVEKLTDYFGELAWVADKLMCISSATERDLRAYCEANGVPCPETEVFALGGEFDPTERFDNEDDGSLPHDLEGKRFALLVSTIEPRKNHRVLYEAWDYLMRHSRLDRAEHRLVFAGRQGWAVEDLVREIKMNPAVRDSILLLGSVSDAQLNTLYRSCAFTLLPSHYEGYGLPLAEALAHGKFCIASEAGSLSEIGGDLVYRIDPRDTVAWANAIAHYIQHPSEVAEREALIQSHYVPVSWDESARQFFDGVARLRTSS
jgi:glycosyltransferase involved in cell wall biosynthesis